MSDNWVRSSTASRRWLVAVGSAVAVVLVVVVVGVAVLRRLGLPHTIGEFGTTVIVQSPARTERIVFGVSQGLPPATTSSATPV